MLAYADVVGVALGVWGEVDVYCAVIGVPDSTSGGYFDGLIDDGFVRGVHFITHFVGLDGVGDGFPNYSGVEVTGFWVSGGALDD